MSVKRIAASSLVALAIVLSLSSWGAAQSALGGNGPSSHGFGIGLAFTAPVNPPNTFPASGLSGRIWLGDLFGIEADFFVVNQAPSFAVRAFVKYLRTPLVDLYVGTGVAFFGFNGGLVAPFQAATGIEIQLTPNVALNAEIGAYFRGVAGITAGLGAYFYF